jgi:NAD(P)-dependent dehydrogenase (short-subunit alcohol dehydrogenase family)
MNQSTNNIFCVQGKSALVTGGTSGIGLMISRGLVAGGAKVTIVARNADRCASVVRELSSLGEIRAVAADVATADGRGTIAATVGADSLHILINNAGLLEQASVDTYGEELWDRALDLNLKAAFFLLQAVLPSLRRSASPSDPARVINISSGHGHRVSPFDHFGYTASKAGLNHLTRHLAQKLAAENINVNAVAPGIFASRQTEHFPAELMQRIESGIPRRRLGEPEDIVGAVLYLSSRAGAYVTSSVLAVDGGWAGIA